MPSKIAVRPQMPAVRRRSPTHARPSTLRSVNHTPPRTAICAASLRHRASTAADCASSLTEWMVMAGLCMIPKAEAGFGIRSYSTKSLFELPNATLTMAPAIAGSRTGGGDRWRRHRDVGRLSPCAYGLEGRRAAGARPAHLGHDVACRGTGRHLRLDVGDLDRASEIHPRSLSAAGGRDRPGDRLQSGRLHRGRRRCRPAGRISPRRRVQSLLRRRCAGDFAGGSEAAVPARARRRHPRRLLRRRRRPRQSRGRDHGARQGRAHGRRTPDRRRARRRRAAPGQPRHRRPHRVRRHRGGVRRQLRGHVGAPARRARRRHHSEPGGRALLPDHRADRGPAAVDAGARRPGIVRLFPRRGRRPAGRPVRAGLRAVARRRHSGGFLVRRDSAGLGAHDALSREGDEPRAGLARGRDQEVLLRPGELHARPAPDRRRGARAQELLRRRRASTRSASSPAAASAGCWHIGSSTARPTPT